METWFTLVIILIHLKISVIFGNPVPLPILVPKACNLTIWNGQSEVTSQHVSVLEGDTVNLMCDARCANEHYTPVLKWIKPDQRLVWDIPGRIFTAPMSSHRLQKLYIQDISRNDAGTYQCEGWVGHWTDATIEINVETQNRAPNE